MKPGAFSLSQHARGWNASIQFYEHPGQNYLIMKNGQALTGQFPDQHL